MHDELKKEVIGAYMYDQCYRTMSEKEELSESLRTNEHLAKWVPPTISPVVFHDAIAKCWHVWRGQLKLRVKGSLMKHPILKNMEEDDKKKLLENYKFIYEDPVEMKGIKNN